MENEGLKIFENNWLEFEIIDRRLRLLSDSQWRTVASKDSSWKLELEQWPSNSVRSTRFVNPERSWQGKMVQLYPPPPFALSSFLFLHLFLLPSPSTSSSSLTINARSRSLPRSYSTERKYRMVTSASSPRRRTRGNPAAFVDPEVRYDSNRKN